MVKLNILDYAVIDEGQTAEGALQDTVKLAQLAEELDYKRFWITEHHNVPAFACASPELMMMQLLAKTQRIRLGSGGVMLPHYSPFKVAENFRLLEAFYPMRVDLGIGNNPGTSSVKKALNETKSYFLDYKQSILDIRDYLTENNIEQRLDNVLAQPSITTVPQMWLLSTSVDSAKMAGEVGMGYTLGTFLLPNATAIQNAKASVQAYRVSFKPTKLNMNPIVMTTVFTVVADDEEYASLLAQALDVWLLGKKQFAEFNRMPSIATAQDYQKSERDKQLIAQNRARMVVGTKATVQSQLEQIIETFDADELMIVPLIPGFENRSRTIELIAEMNL
ncbi:LLM class flavin-dependent oxidoreductase [Staphylococcus shinii]|uniref:LLM class flavin-dependent oxidoreductase n=1 Tax=Staphylococcus shinii TaxID=2912228 RepID=A0A418IHT4_9STAP|nr:LLM class flavin-dependent oxidoreductase [Staphylococcus shinii]MDW8563385.1 LLM class flavin-dependent oxidoreductase [Staphylococcus shinii]MDW8566622.1 LLM class flavin-dependent oxidoreductase [Staphylococcus shinii]RIN02281.1 LLM class flavin-dependent oxidoreductase [Staphylococcus shinii]RIN09685.1 LLM class flavin-dependent oxidoreductase [Staphylococcus shinii]